jgi:hypothetical protein
MPQGVEQRKEDNKQDHVHKHHGRWPPAKMLQRPGIDHLAREDDTMATVADRTTARNTPVRHYAHLGDTEGIAELVSGTGYLFRPTGARQATLVSYRDPELFLHGLVDDAPPADPRPLWQIVADPAYYNGTTRRGTLAGGR